MHRTTNDHERFVILTKFKLILLAVAMVVLWGLGASTVMTAEEELAWEKVRAAQLYLADWRQEQGTSSPAEADPWRSGLIGLEWSGTTTTLGDLPAKRTACDPAWAVQYLRWFHELGLKPGDPVSIFSSGSFPGLLLSALVASEVMELDTSLVVSLGASTWGANHPDAPWPVLAAELRRRGFVRERADFYTLGGGGEVGNGLSSEGEALLRQSANDAGGQLLEADSLEAMIALKSDLLKESEPELFISIGGSHANLGDDEKILNLPPGLVHGDDLQSSGNGVVGAAMKSGIPVIHMLNLKRLSLESGIPFDSEPKKSGPGKSNMLLCAAGVALFLVLMWRHKRWHLAPEVQSHLQ